MTLLADIKKNIAFITEDALDLDVANHSAHGSDWVKISDMMNPDIARNNCWVTSNEIYENVELEEYANIHEVDIIGVEATGCTHYAVYVANETEQVVIDFTARQFSPDAPFPFVLPVDKWHAYMEHVTGRELIISFGD
jgi:hypothetical protein